MEWDANLNDTLPNCTTAACANAVQIWRDGVGPTDDEILRAFSRWGSKHKHVMRGFWRDGLGGLKIKCFARLADRAEVGEAIDRFGCAYLSMGEVSGVKNHVVLAIDAGLEGITFVTWGRVQQMVWAEYEAKVKQAYAFSPKWSWKMAWWQIKNDPTWWAFLALIPLIGWAAL